MSSPNIGITIDCASDFRACCPRKASLHCCCLHAEASSDDDEDLSVDEKIEVAAAPVFEAKKKESCCLIL